MIFFPARAFFALNAGPGATNVGSFEYLAISACARATPLGLADADIVAVPTSAVNAAMTMSHFRLCTMFPFFEGTAAAPAGRTRMDVETGYKLVSTRSRS